MLDGSMLQTVKKLYVPRVEDKNSNMRMFNISRIDDLVANSMNILEPASVDADGNEREDGILVNLLILSSFCLLSLNNARTHCYFSLLAFCFLRKVYKLVVTFV